MGFLDSLKNSSFIKWVKRTLQTIILPGMNGITLYELISVYINGIRELELGNRVAAISWRLFISLFPFIMFFLLLIQYLPYFNEIEQYFYSEILSKILPPNIIDSTWDFLNTRQESLNQRYGNANFLTILIGVIIFLVSSTTGINSLIKGLNFSEDEDTYNRERNGIKQFSTALYLNLILTLLLILSVLTFYFFDVIGAILEQEGVPFFTNSTFTDFVKYLLFALFYFIAICLIYYIGPKTKLRIRQIYPGAILTTILYLLNIGIFTFYISNVANMNLLYGSLATILIIMISLYINVMLIIIGYQLNLSIIESKKLSQQ